MLCFNLPSIRLLTHPPVFFTPCFFFFFSFPNTDCQESESSHMTRTEWVAPLFLRGSSCERVRVGEPTHMFRYHYRRSSVDVFERNKRTLTSRLAGSAGVKSGISVYSSVFLWPPPNFMSHRNVLKTDFNINLYSFFRIMSSLAVFQITCFRRYTSTQIGECWPELRASVFPLTFF